MDSPARGSAQARVARLASQPLIIGSLVTSGRTCGNPGCRCARGHRHVSTYLAVRHNNKRVMISVPREHLAVVRQWVNTHRAMQKALEVISKDCLDAFLTTKKGSNLC